MTAARRLQMLALAGAAVFLLGPSPLAAQQDHGLLRVETTTGRAGVFIDGHYVGPAENFRAVQEYDITPGIHDVKISDPRYEEIELRVNIKPGWTTTISEPLKPLPEPQGPFGELRTEGPDHFAAVFLNERFMGHVDEFSNVAQGLLLPPGEYTVRIGSTIGGPEFIDHVKIVADETVTIRIAS
jgi:PEGA domain-containing protein